MRSYEPRIGPYKNTWKRLQNTVFWCNLKLAQEKDFQFYTLDRMELLFRHTPSDLYRQSGLHEDEG